jgi:acetyl esterase
MVTLRRAGLAGVLLGTLIAAAGTANAQDCAPLQPSGSQGGALLPGALMHVRYGGADASPLALDVYAHGGRDERPLAVVLRGGAGTIGQRASYVGQLVELFGDAGYVVATPDYRAGSMAEGAEDVIAVLRFLATCHASALRVAREKVVLVAEDSAAPVALAAVARLRHAVAGGNGTVPAPAALALVGARLSGAIAPAVPTVIVHGGADSEVPIGDARTLCARAAASCTVMDVAGASHRAENWWPSQWGYRQDLLRALEPRVGRVPAPVRPPAGAAALRKRLVFDAAHGLTLDAWMPPGSEPRAAVVIVHGGGWEAGDRVTYVPPMLGLAASLGLAWFSIDYRLTPDVTNREQVADVKAALAWIRAHADVLRVDPQRLVLVGESASGQLVTHVAASEPGLQGVVSFYGVYDLEAMAGDPSNPRSLARRLFRLTSLDEQARALLREFSPVRQASRSLPPLLLIAGTADRLVAQQREYHRALLDAGARVDAVEIEGAPHGMEAWHDEQDWRTWESSVGAWIQARLGNPR